MERERRAEGKRHTESDKLTKERERDGETDKQIDLEPEIASDGGRKVKERERKGGYT